MMEFDFCNMNVVAYAVLFSLIVAAGAWYGGYAERQKINEEVESLRAELRELGRPMPY